jgi:plastocyanin
VPPERTRRATVGGIAALLTAGWLAGCTGDDDGPAPVVRATDALAFEPRELAVTAGETIVWVNRSSVSHSTSSTRAAVQPSAAARAGARAPAHPASRPVATVAAVATTARRLRPGVMSGRTARGHLASRRRARLSR